MMAIYNQSDLSNTSAYSSQDASSSDSSAPAPVRSSRRRKGSPPKQKKRQKRKRQSKRRRRKIQHYAQQEEDSNQEEEEYNQYGEADDGDKSVDYSWMKEKAFQKTVFVENGNKKELYQATIISPSPKHRQSVQEKIVDDNYKDDWVVRIKWESTREKVYVPCSIVHRKKNTDDNYHDDNRDRRRRSGRKSIQTNRLFDDPDWTKPQGHNATPQKKRKKKQQRGTYSSPLKTSSPKKRSVWCDTKSVDGDDEVKDKKYNKEDTAAKEQWDGKERKKKKHKPSEKKKKIEHWHSNTYSSSSTSSRKRKHSTQNSDSQVEGKEIIYDLCTATDDDDNNSNASSVKSKSSSSVLANAVFGNSDTSSLSSADSNSSPPLSFTSSEDHIQEEKLQEPDYNYTNVHTNNDDGVMVEDPHQFFVTQQHEEENEEANNDNDNSYQESIKNDEDGTHKEKIQEHGTRNESDRSPTNGQYNLVRDEITVEFDHDGYEQTSSSATKTAAATRFTTSQQRRKQQQQQEYECNGTTVAIRNGARQQSKQQPQRMQCKNRDIAQKRTVSSSSNCTYPITNETLVYDDNSSDDNDHMPLLPLSSSLQQRRQQKSSSKIGNKCRLCGQTMSNDNTPSSSSSSSLQIITCSHPPPPSSRPTFSFDDYPHLSRDHRYFFKSTFIISCLPSNNNHHNNNNKYGVFAQKDICKGQVFYDTGCKFYENVTRTSSSRHEERSYLYDENGIVIERSNKIMMTSQGYFDPTGTMTESVRSVVLDEQVGGNANVEFVLMRCRKPANCWLDSDEFESDDDSDDGYKKSISNERIAKHELNLASILEWRIIRNIKKDEEVLVGCRLEK